MTPPSARSAPSTMAPTAVASVWPSAPPICEMNEFDRLMPKKATAAPVASSTKPSSLLPFIRASVAFRDLARGGLVSGRGPLPELIVRPDLHLDAPVLGAAVDGGVVGQGARLTHALRGHARARHACGSQIRDDCIGPLAGELVIRLLRTGAVGEALHDDLGVRILLQHLGEGAEVLLCRRLQLRAIGVEEDRRAEVDHQFVALAHDAGVLEVPVQLGLLVVHVVADERPDAGADRRAPAGADQRTRPRVGGAGGAQSEESDQDDLQHACSFYPSRDGIIAAPPSGGPHYCRKSEMSPTLAIEGSLRVNHGFGRRNSLSSRKNKATGTRLAMSERDLDRKRCRSLTPMKKLERAAGTTW